MNIIQNGLEGVYLGISNNDEVVMIDPFEKRQNSNGAIMASAGSGMNFMVKKALIAEVSRMENESKRFVLIDPQHEFRQLAALIGADVITELR